MSIKKFVVLFWSIFAIFLMIYYYKNIISSRIGLGNTVINTHKTVKDSIKDTSIALKYNNKIKLPKNLEKYKKYKTFTWFLKNIQKSVKLKGLDLLKDDFVICLKWEGSWMIYIPFYQDEIEKDYYNTWDVMYQYMSYIDKAVSNNCIYWWEKSNVWSKIIFEKSFRNDLSDIVDDIFNRRSNVYYIIKWIKKIKKRSKNYNELLAYLYDLIWSYSSWEALKKKYEKKETIIDMSWFVKDENDNPIQWAKIYLLNNSKYYTYSNKKWQYKLKFKYYPFSHLRFKATKKWYSDWYFTVPLDFSKKPKWHKRVTKTFHLIKSKNVKTINWWEQKIDKHLFWKDFYIFRTKQSTYYVPVNWLHYKNGNIFKKWKITVYLYEFNKWSKIDDLMHSDTFSPVYWYVWNLMKTFWMPYIQFFDEKWNELFIRKSNPMLLINKIYHMKELYENYDKIYTAITKKDMQYLYNISKKWWYPITYEWLIKNNFLRWPTWWVLERQKWTWVSVPHKVIDPKWVVQLKFWQIDK